MEGNVKKYKFTYDVAVEVEPGKVVLHESKYYVHLDNDNGIRQSLMLAEAVDRFMEANPEVNISKIEVIPYHEPIQTYNPGGIVEKIINDYHENSDSMTDIICCALEDGESLSDNEIQYLIELSGDDDYVAPEDIRSIAKPYIGQEFYLRALDTVTMAEKCASFTMEIAKQFAITMLGNMSFLDDMKTTDIACMEEQKKAENSTDKNDEAYHKMMYDQLSKYRHLLEQFIDDEEQQEVKDVKAK